ncbi:zinc ribbon domain-containing protein [Segetibacter koreensis]|uniref:zinc ribbon domain-containing protein n=1 Tax=Segetibacter koreensis TaxID=398037 RepID=UPI00035E5886
MDPQMFCQSCTMPIDNINDRGTEKDGSKSSEYCKYCYQNGAFINPDMTMEQMKSFLAAQMPKMNIQADIIEKSLNILPYLKRWQKVKA